LLVRTPRAEDALSSRGEATVYRLVERSEILYGHYREYVEIFDELVAIQRARGWQESSLWGPTFGKGNEVVSITEYPDLAAFQRETEVAGSDAEFMKVFRSQADHVVQGSVHSELLEPAPHVV